MFSTFLDVFDEKRGEVVQAISASITTAIDNILHKRDLGRRYVFKIVEEDTLKKEPLGSDKFIQFCEFDKIK